MTAMCGIRIRRPILGPWFNELGVPSAPIARTRIRSRCVVLVAVCVGFSMLSRRATAATRYRVASRWSVVCVVVVPPIGYAILFGLLTLVGPLPSDAPIRRVAYLLALPTIIGILVGLNFCTLLAATAVGVTTRRRFAKWNEIAAIVFTRGDDPRSFEVGVLVKPGANPPWSTPMPVREGEVLTDLPLRVRVPRSKFSADRLAWAIDRFADPGTALVERTAMGVIVHRQGAFPHPAGRDRNN
ncbi:hypothetical protein [Gordonia sp. ABSL49_1]|uniref:hypothetical protein n=1 Tax=unclassified Gordonia (in: high G+C Gram-positive bacteria) TaxID=2657482 RepID=UPI001F0F9901|nr:hypothetical protein [Gordonia sp. ABSL49_1]MCH5645292.1 hypothetical protein [Gordonia sp. ABSL49_1]